MIKDKIERDQPFLVVKANALGNEIYSVTAVGLNYNGQLTIRNYPMVKKHQFQEFRQYKHLFKRTDFGEDGCIYDYGNFKGRVDKRLKKNLLISLK